MNTFRAQVGAEFGGRHSTQFALLILPCWVRIFLPLAKIFTGP